MKDNELLMIILAFFLGFCFRKMMGWQLIEGTLPNGSSCDNDSECASGHCYSHSCIQHDFVKDFVSIFDIF